MGFVPLKAAAMGWAQRDTVSQQHGARRRHVAERRRGSHRPADTRVQAGCPLRERVPPKFCLLSPLHRLQPSHPRAYQEPQRCLGPAAPVAQLERGRGLRKPPRVPLPPSPFPFPAPSAAAQTSWSQAALPGIYSSFLPLLAGRPGTGLLSPASSPCSQPTAGRRRSVGPRLSPAAPPPWPGVPGSRCRHLGWGTAPGDRVDGAGCCHQHPSLLGRLCRAPGTSRPHVSPPGTSISHPMLSVCTHGCSLCAHSPSYRGCGAELSPWHKRKVPGVSQAVFEEGGITPNPTAGAAGMEPSPSPVDGGLTLEPGGFLCPPRARGTPQQGEGGPDRAEPCSRCRTQVQQGQESPGGRPGAGSAPSSLQGPSASFLRALPRLSAGQGRGDPAVPSPCLPLPVAPLGALGKLPARCHAPAAHSSAGRRRERGGRGRCEGTTRTPTPRRLSGDRCKTPGDAPSRSSGGHGALWDTVAAPQPRARPRVVAPCRFPRGTGAWWNHIWSLDSAALWAGPGGRAVPRPRCTLFA